MRHLGLGGPFNTFVCGVFVFPLPTTPARANNLSVFFIIVVKHLAHVPSELSESRTTCAVIFLPSVSAPSAFARFALELLNTRA